MENGLQIWRLDANSFKFSRGWTTRGGPSDLGVGEVLTTPHNKNVRSYEIFQKALDLVKKNDKSSVCGICVA